MDATRPWAGRRLHLVGIGGAGMSGYALAALALGAEVSGSDAAESGATARLRAHGIEPSIGHAAANVPDGAEVVYSTAVPEDNPERVAARARGLRERPRAELLGELSGLRRTIAVAGTHGKTTTSAMVVHALRGAGLDPCYLVGGELRATGENAAWGPGEWLVVEADESDRSFLALHPEIAVLTNVELDHHATYGSRLELDAAMRAFLALASQAAIWDRPELLALRDGPVTPYDASPAAVELGPGGSSFSWEGIDVALIVPGLHNARNAVGALTACRLAGADPARAAAALADFPGVRRRFERLGETPSGAVVYDDYAHHPTEVGATLAAARSFAPRRLVAIFQPHLYSRTAQLARAFGAALALADVVCVLDVYPARERAQDFPGVSGRLIAQAAADAARGRPVWWLPTIAAARGALAGELRAGDLVLTLGAGDVDRLGRELVTEAGS